MSQINMYFFETWHVAILGPKTKNPTVPRISQRRFMAKVLDPQSQAPIKSR